jgi:predicted DNA-binding protein
MEALLDEKDLLELVTELYSAKVVIQEGDTEQVKKEKRDRLVELRKNDKKCKSQIIQRIADSHLEYVKDAETAYEMWSTLRTTFERKSMASQVLLRKKLLTMKFNVGTDSMNTHFLKFDGTIRELKSAGANLEQSDVVCHLLLTMPPEYDTVVTAIETLASEELTISFVKNRLLDEESKRLGSRQEKGKEASTSSAFVAPTRNKKFDGRSKLKCFNCGIIGHKKSECRMPKSKTEAKICEVNTELLRRVRTRRSRQFVVPRLWLYGASGEEQQFPEERKATRETHPNQKREIRHISDCQRNGRHSRRNCYR